MSEPKLMQIFIMGKAYDVPDGITIMDAMEYAGYRFVRGAGCRSGFCGACGTVYRKDGEYRLEFALACQEMVEDGMHLTQLPFTPAPRVDYVLDELDARENVLLQYYPAIARCVSCNTCTKACPQDIEVMDFVQAALRGDLQKVSEIRYGRLPELQAALEAGQQRLAEVQSEKKLLKEEVRYISSRITSRYYLLGFR